MVNQGIDRPKKASVVKIRFLVFLIGTLCPVVCYMSRQNIAIALVAIVDDSISNAINQDNNATARANNTSSPIDKQLACPVPTEIGEDGRVEAKKETYGPKYNWTTYEKNFCLQAFFYTYVIFQIPAGRVAEIIGAKWILLTAALGSSLLSAISPFAISLSPYAYSIIRALMGICQTALYPAGYVLFTKWLPPTERSTALTLLGVGAYVGSIIASISTGYFSEQKNYGWEYAFYMPAVVCFIWSLIWLLISANEPRAHKLISIEEIEYIESRMEVKATSNGKGGKRVSWLKLLSSQHIWAMNAAFLASNWAFTIILLLLPSYLNDILNFPALQNGFINAIIYALYCVAAPVVGAISTLMIETRAFGLKRIQIRKLFQSVALFSQALAFIALPIIGCDTKLVLALLFSQIVFFSFINGGEIQLPSELSLDFAGTIYAIGNCIGSSTGFLVPYVHTKLVPFSNDMGAWNRYFYVAASITSIGGLIFLIFGRNDLQDFSIGESESEIDIYQLSMEKDLKLEKAKEKKGKMSP